MALPITYEYKIFRNGDYLGSLQKVVSEFRYTLDINNGSAPMNVQCKVLPFGTRQQLNTIDTESGSALTTEADVELLTESQPVQFGRSTSGALIANDNDILVYEFSPDYPSGKLVFSGWITSWDLSHKEALISINCMSYGMDLNDYIVQTGIAYSAQITQGTSGSNSTPMLGNLGGGDYSCPQTFIPGSSYSIGKIKLGTAGSFSTNLRMRMRIYQGSPGGSANVLMGTSATIPQTTTSATTYDFIFASPVAVVSGGEYFFIVDSPDSAGIFDTVYISNVGGNLYTSGNIWPGNSTTNTYTELPGYDAEFTIYSVDSNVVSPYSSQDPTNIFKSVIDNYHSAGGRANYSGSSWTLTGLTVSYTFNLARTLEAIKKCLDLAPANFYWTVDPADSTAYFKSFNTTADQTLKIGVHIDDVKIGLDAEGVRNVLYFTGGPTAGVNLFRKYTDTASVSNTGRQRLETKTDNRVTVLATADAIADALLDSVSTEQYQTVVKLFRNGGLDITTFLPGQTIGFSGFSTFIDSLVLNIVRLARYPDRVELTLGSIPPRASSVLKQLENDVEDLQTLNNPASPT